MKTIQRYYDFSPHVSPIHKPLGQYKRVHNPAYNPTNINIVYRIVTYVISNIAMNNQE